MRKPVASFLKLEGGASVLRNRLGQPDEPGWSRVPRKPREPVGA
jgi:hypothetical protein